MDSSRLLIDLGTLLARSRDLRKLLQGERLQAALKARCALVDEHAGVPGVLGAIARERPDLYEFALWAAALTVPLAEALPIPAQEGDALFLAALLQDCGLLRLTGRQTPLAHEQHPVLSQQHLENQCRVPEQVTQCVLHQHERYDGTGFPSGKLETELSDAELALGLINELVRIRLSGATVGNHTLSDATPILRFNQGPYFNAVCRQLLALLAAAEIPPGDAWATEKAPAHIHELTEDIGLLQRWMQQLEPLKKALGGLTMTPNVARCRLIAQALQHAAASSGIIDVSTVRWAEHAASNQLTEAFGELQELQALHQELFHRLGWITDFLDELEMESGELTKPLNALRQNMRALNEHRARRRGEDDFIVMDV